MDKDTYCPFKMARAGVYVEIEYAAQQDGRPPTEEQQMKQFMESCAEAFTPFFLELWEEVKKSH